MDAGTGATAIQIGNSAAGHGIQIGTGAGANAIIIGSTFGASSLNLQGGSGGVTVGLGSYSTTAFQLQTSANTNILTADTTDNNLIIGSSNGYIASWSTNAATLTTSLYAAASVSANGYIYEIGGSTDTSGQCGIGGSSPSPVNTVYYALANGNGSTGSWSTTTTLPVSLCALTATVANGYIYVFGGANSGGNDVATVYSALICTGSNSGSGGCGSTAGTVGTWNTGLTALPSTNDAGGAFTANGYVYVAGGEASINSTGNGVVYYALVCTGSNSGSGGCGSTAGTVGTWNSFNASETEEWPAVAYYNGYMYMSGGWDSGLTYTIQYAKLNASTGNISGSWTTSSALPAAIANATSVVSNGVLYIIGGETVTNSTGTKTVYATNLNGSTGAIGTVYTLPSLPTNVAYGTSVVNGNYLYVLGGETNGTGTPENTVYYGTTAPTTLQLASKSSSGDPATEIDGAMYYNSYLGQFRCGISGSWTNCSNAGGGLARNSPDTSTAAISASNFLYQFTNSSSGVTSSVLQLINGTNTGSTLNVTASGNPVSGQALIFASNTNASPSGNLIDLQAGSSPTSQFSVSAGGAVTSAGSVSIASGKSYTGAGSVTVSSGGANTLSLDTGGGAAINIGGTNATSLVLGNSSATITDKVENSSATAYQIQNASTSKTILAVDTSANQVALGSGSSLNGQLAFYNSTNNNSAILASGVTTGSSYTLYLPTTNGSSGQCLELGGVTGQLQFAACGTSIGLAKNAADTSSATVSSGYLYQFTNGSSAVASGVLQLINGSNTGSALNVTATANPTSGQALIFASNTNASPSGNLIDLQSGSSPASVFSVNSAGSVKIASGQSYTGAGIVNVSSTGANAVNIDTGGAADINIAPTNANDVKVGKPFILTDAGNAFQDAQAPTASSSNSLINLVTTGATFSGNSSGTFIGVSAATGYAGDLINLETNGTSEFSVDASGNTTISGAIRQGNSVSIYNTGSNTPNTVYTTSVTLTTSDILLERFVQANPTSAAVTFTTPTAAQIVAAIPHATIGDTFTFVISNAGNKAITLGQGTGVTINATNTPATGTNMVDQYLCRLTNVSGGSQAVTCY